MSTALTVSEENDLLKIAIAEVGGKSLPIIPQIGMVNNMSDVEGMSIGEYYIRRSVEEDGERKTVYQSIGFKPELIILLRRYTYSRFSKSQDKLIAWTNELEGFSDDDMVHLINNKGEKPQLETSLPYPQFKSYINRTYRDDEGKMTLKFKNVLYVKYENEIYRMFLSNASVTGIPAGEDHGDYKNPQKGSFTAWERTLKAPEPQAYFFRTVKMGQSEVQGKDYRLMTFEDLGMNDDATRKQLLHDWHQLKRDLVTLQNIQFKQFIQRPFTAAVDELPTLDSSDEPPPFDPTDLPL